MKRLITFLLSLILFGLSFTLLAQTKVGFLMDNYSSDRWLLDEKLFCDEVRKHGGIPIVELAFGDPDAQYQLAQQMLDEGIDVLVIVPTDAAKAADIVKLAKSKDVPVLAYDRLINYSDVDLYISYDNKKVGKLQANYALEHVPNGKYLLLNGPETDNNAILFRQGQLEVLKPFISKGKIELLDDKVMSQWNELEALLEIELFLNSNDEIPDVIIAANDAFASAVISAIDNHDLKGKIKVIGQDAENQACRNIALGYQTMTVYKPIKPLAEQAAEAAIKLVNGKKIDDVNAEIDNRYKQVPSILLEPILVDINNLKETVIKDGHVSLSSDLEY
jgi:D-xylose transport system substrate-binding protein